MIPPQHVHSLRPFRSVARPDGAQEIWSRCDCGGPLQPELHFEQRIITAVDGQPLGLHFRIGGVWFDPADVIRYAAHVKICETCGAVARPDGLPPCSTCRGLGVVDATSGDAIEPPPVPTRV